MTTPIEKILVYILTGSTGLTGLHNARMYLEQFPSLPATPRIFPMIASNEQVDEIVLKAKNEGAVLVHTFMKKDLAAHTNKAAKEQGVVCIDLVSGPIAAFEAATGLASAQTPGHVHHHGHAAVPQALRFAHAHDDGGGVRQLNLAHIVLVGLSGAGKTEVANRLSLYGLWVGNVPIVAGVPPPLHELSTADRRRVYYLDVGPEQLEARRRERWDATAGSNVEKQYVDFEAIRKEVTMLRRLVTTNGWKTIHAIGKTVEQIVSTIIEKYQHDFPLS